jgi:predicted DCC family thiol-disulfide oxidoreductase YuxK
VTESRPSTAPRATLLVFDGDCAFCTSAVERLKGVLPRFPRTSPWQWLDLDEYGLSKDDVTRFAWVVTSDARYPGHLAGSALLRMQEGFGWRFLGHLIATPPVSWVASVVYNWVAANRHRLPGGTPACAMPRAE